MSASKVSEGIRVMAKEKSLAEQCVGLLNTVGRQKIEQYAKGIELYASAKSDFDGLIEQLIFNLERGKRLKSSDTALQAAVNQRTLFTTYVSNTLVDESAGDKSKSLLGDILGASDLVKAIIDGSVAMWREYRDASRERKEALRSQLAGLKWRTFAELIESR